MAFQLRDYILNNCLYNIRNIGRKIRENSCNNFKFYYRIRHISKFYTFCLIGKNFNSSCYIIDYNRYYRQRFCCVTVNQCFIGYNLNNMIL